MMPAGHRPVFLMDSASSSLPYDRLTPDTVLDAVESAGLVCDGTLLALNSYENRVYQVGIEDDAPRIAKFYRPGRWSDAAILEEHAFLAELAALEIPAVPALPISGTTLLKHAEYRFTLFARRGGRAPDLERADHLEWLGRFLGRLHAAGASRTFQCRPALDPDVMGDGSVRFLLAGDFIPDYLVPAWQGAAETLLAGIHAAFAATGPARQIRLHGDCHPGNILWTDQGPHFVDFDDSISGPAIQDLWMLLSGTADDMAGQLQALLEGYERFTVFDPAELALIEPLRGLRLLNYSAWLARRWQDPAFPQAFPWFGTPRYWEEQVQTLREQTERLQLPHLVLR